MLLGQKEKNELFYMWLPCLLNIDKYKGHIRIDSSFVAIVPSAADCPWTFKVVLTEFLILPLQNTPDLKSQCFQYKVWGQMAQKL